LAAVQQDGRVLEFASQQLKCNETIVLAAVQQHGLALMFASSELQANQKIVLAAAKTNTKALQHASKELMGNQTFVLALLRQFDPTGCLFISVLWRFVTNELKGDETFATAAVKQDCYALEHLSAEMRGHVSVVQAAVQQGGQALAYASKELQGSETTVLAAVQQNGSALRCASAKLQGDKAIVLAALQQNGDVIVYASPELQHSISLEADKYSMSVQEYARARVNAQVLQIGVVTKTDTAVKVTCTTLAGDEVLVVLTSGADSNTTGLRTQLASKLSVSPASLDLIMPSCEVNKPDSNPREIES